MRDLWWLLALTVGACSSGSTPEAQCERKAYDDPKVAEIYSRSNGSYTWEGPERDELNAALRAATIKCLRERGLAPPGGVEMVRQRT